MRKITWAFTGMALIIASMPSMANLDSSLHGMWATATTSPQVINSQTRKGVMGGSFDARWPVKSYNLLSIDPPRVDAGCGGISLYMGAFTFIKLDEFKKMLRNIGSAAEGYFFKLALKAICNDCLTTLSDLQSEIAKLNQANINSCKLGSDLASMASNNIPAMKDKLGEQKLNYATMYNSIWSKADLADSQSERSAAPDVTAKTAAEDAGGNDNPEYALNGNILWRKLVAKNTSDLFNDQTGTFGGTFSGEKINYYIISILGTKVYSKAADAGTSCPTGKTCTSKDTDFNPKLSLLDLVQGNPTGSTGKKYYKCKVANEPWNGCLNLEEDVLDFKGPEAFVNKMLFGTDTGQNAPTPTSVVGQIKNATATLSPDAQTFINMVPFPILRYFVEAQSVEGGVESVATMAKPYVVKAMTYRLAVSIRSVVGAIYDGKQGTSDNNFAAELPEFKNRLQEFDKDIRTLYADMESAKQSFYTSNDFVKNMRKFSGSAFLTMN